MSSIWQKLYITKYLDKISSKQNLRNQFCQIVAPRETHLHSELEVCRLLSCCSKPLRTFFTQPDGPCWFPVSSRSFLLNSSFPDIWINQNLFLFLFFEQNKSPQGLVGLRNLGNTVSSPTSLGGLLINSVSHCTLNHSHHHLAPHRRLINPLVCLWFSVFHELHPTMSEQHSGAEGLLPEERPSHGPQQQLWDERSSHGRWDETRSETRYQMVTRSMSHFTARQ